MDEIHFRALRELSQDGHLSQRDLSRRLSMSLGKVNYVVRSLMEKGYIKARRFKNARNKLAYMYVLTPHGMRRKLEITGQFIIEKTREYERLQREIEELRREMDMSRAEAAPAGGTTNEEEA